MAYRLLCFASAVLISFFISSGKTIVVKMCESGTTSINDDSLELDAVGPSRNPLTTNTSITCSCSINVTFYRYLSNVVSIKFSRTSTGRLYIPGNGCSMNEYDKATLGFASNPPTQSLALQNDDLSDFNQQYDGVSTIRISITISSICGSNYTVQLDARSNYNELSHVTCSNPKSVVTSSFTTASPTAMKSTGLSKSDVVSTYSPIENNSAGSVVEKNVSAPSATSDPSQKNVGLIVGVVVGVGGGLLIIGAVILAVLIFRRRRTKPQPLTNSNQNAPTENSYEPTVEYAAVSYEELRNSTHLQTGILYDNRRATTYPLDTESGQNYYNLQGNVNSSFHHSDAVSINDQTTSSSEVDNFVRDPHSINDTDTTVIENDLYEK